MPDAGQILIIAAITIMTTILTIIGIQLIFILRDIRRIVNRANDIMSSLEKLGMNFKSGSAEIIGFIVGLKRVFTVIDHMSDNKKKKNGTS